MSEPIKPCPIIGCGGGGMPPNEIDGGAVFCETCWVSGPFCARYDDAIAAWNALRRMEDDK